MCKVITVSNQKGGTAKTTSCVNLGIGLASNGKRVLLIDADPQGSLSISLGYQEPDSFENTLATFFIINLKTTIDINKLSSVPMNNAIANPSTGPFPKYHKTKLEIIVVKLESRIAEKARPKDKSTAVFNVFPAVNSSLNLS